LKRGIEQSEVREGGPLLGIVIPTLNEEDALPLLLSDLAQLRVPHRIAVVDGGSRDSTQAVARKAGALVLEGPRGRATQMNRGAQLLDTPWLLFLHADSRFPGEAREALEEWLAQASMDQAGHFGFALEGRHWFWRFIELGQGIRERFSGLVYGDQGLVLSRRLFSRVGGYPDLPTMEDVEMVRRLRRSAQLRRIPAFLPTSPRRYEEEGRWRGWLRNVVLISLYKLGVPPGKLASFYAARPSIPSRALLVFAKAPVPGQVKTRLAAETGREEAASIYEWLGRKVLDQVRRGPYRTVVFFDPPEARESVEGWLGADDLEFVPQTHGDLGARLDAAFGWAFGETDQVVVVGTDAPDVDSDLVMEAFRSLETADLILGPATDGGYYLLGLKNRAPGLFDAIPWSTASVLAETRARAQSLGLSEALLPTLSDVDTLQDWLKVTDRVTHDR
jgi:rSAM/selenodomain-associated transferase 2/rSAM/selenodomain-associated transferase 1